MAANSANSADSSDQEDPVSKKGVGRLNQPGGVSPGKVTPGSVMPGVLRGMQRSIPVVLCYLPVSFAFGVLAVKAGMSAFEALAMGIMVYAGSGQLIAVGLLAAGAGTANIIFTTFVVNLRHLLMSAAVSPYLAKWPRLSQALFAYEMTDETFAVHISHFGHESAGDPAFAPGRAETMALNFTAHASWFGGGFLGALFGDVLGDVKPYGFDFALAGMFISLVVPHFANSRLRMVALIAGVTSISFLLLGEKQWNVMLATVVAATVGAFIPDPDKKSGPDKSGPDKSGTGTLCQSKTKNTCAPTEDGYVNDSLENTAPGMDSQENSSKGAGQC